MPPCDGAVRPGATKAKTGRGIQNSGAGRRRASALNAAIVRFSAAFKAALAKFKFTLQGRWGDRTGQPSARSVGGGATMALWPSSIIMMLNAWFAWY